MDTSFITALSISDIGAVMDTAFLKGTDGPYSLEYMPEEKKMFIMGHKEGCKVVLKCVRSRRKVNRLSGID